MALISLMSVPDAVSLIHFILTSELSWDWSSIEFILPIGLLLVGAVGLVYEKRWAWSLSVLVLAYRVTTMLVFIIWQIQMSQDPVMDLFTPYDTSGLQLPLVLSMLMHLTILALLLTKRSFSHLEVPSLNRVVALGSGILLAFISLGMLMFG